MVVAFASGTATAFFQPASTGLVPQAVSAGRLQQGNAMLNLSQSSAQLIGPVLSGILVVTIGAGWVFAIDAVSFAVSAAALASLRFKLPPPEAHGSFLADLKTGWREVAKRAWLPPSLVAFSFVNLAFAGFLVLGPTVMAASYGGAADWGLVVAMFGLGGLIGGAVALRWRPARPLIVVFALMAVNSLRLVGLSVTPPLVAVLAFVFVASVATTLGDTVWHTTVQTQVPARSLSRVSSYDWMVSLLFFPVGAAVAGPLAESVGAPAAMLLFAVVSSRAEPARAAVARRPIDRAPRPARGRRGRHGPSGAATGRIAVRPIRTLGAGGRRGC